MNWVWLASHKRGFLFYVFLVLGASHILLSIPSGWKLYVFYRKRRVFRLLKLFAYLLISVGLDGIFKLIANIDPPFCLSGPIQYPTWWAWWFWSGSYWPFISIVLLWWEVFFSKGNKTVEAGTETQQAD